MAKIIQYKTMAKTRQGKTIANTSLDNIIANTTQYKTKLEPIRDKIRII